MSASIGVRLRRRLNNALIDGAFETASALLRRLPSSQPARHGVSRIVDVPYRGGGDRAHLLDVYRPAQAPPGLLPAVLYIHGGSFRILSKDSHFMMGIEFARAGYVVFNVNYRLAPPHPFPAAVEDVTDAYQWVVDNAVRWGGDPARLVVAGESAGGNLTLALAVMATYPRPEPYARRIYQLGVVPKAIAPLCGMLQVSDPSQPRGTRPSAMVRDRIDACAESYLGTDDTAPSEARALADPILIMETGKPTRPFPPSFASVGGRDPIQADTLRLDRVLKDWGVACETRVYPGMPHAFQAMTFRRVVQEQWQALFDFLGPRV
jgi:acetyl esterase